MVVDEDHAWRWKQFFSRECDHFRISAELGLGNLKRGREFRWLSECRALGRGRKALLLWWCFWILRRSIASVTNQNKMQSSEQEAISNESVTVIPETVIEPNMDVDVGTIVDNISGKASLEAPPTGGAVSEKEAGEENISQDTSAAKKTRKILSHEVQDESSSDIGTVKEEEGAAQERNAIVEAAESGQDAPRWSSSGVETYAIQCNSCFKWRVIPSKEKYEAIGEHILQQPFVCANAQEWRENIKCDDPADLDDNEPTVLWAIDKHNIPRPPRGFYRKVVLRAENAKKFADIYYKTPCGKTLRSMVQVQKYLDEHPELEAKITQFSFTSPKGRTDALGAGVSTKRLLKNETQSSTESRKRMKGSIPNPDPMRLKSPGRGQPPRPRPLIGEGPDAKSKSLPASKPNALRQDKPKLEKVEASKSGPHLMKVKKEKLEADRGAK